MARKRKKPEDNEMAIDFTPIIDCAFNLLIFFMVTLKFSTTEGQLSAELPKDVGLSRSYQTPKDLDKLKIHISYDEKTKRPTYRAGRTTTQKREDLLGEVVRFVQRSPGVPVEISPDGEVPYAFLVLVMDVCTKAEAKEIQFSGVAAPIE